MAFPLFGALKRLGGAINPVPRIAGIGGFGKPSLGDLASPGWDPDNPPIRKAQFPMAQLNDPAPAPESAGPSAVAPTPRIPPGPQPANGIPGGVLPSPSPAGPQGRAGEYGEARDVFLQGTPKGFKGRLLSGAKSFLGGRGFIPGVIDPRGERLAEFNTQIAPQIGQRWQMEDQDRARALEAEKAGLEQDYRRAQMANYESEAERRAAQSALEQDRFGLEKQKFDLESRKPTMVSPGAGVLLPGEKTPSYTQPFKPDKPEKPEKPQRFKVGNKLVDAFGNEYYQGEDEQKPVKTAEKRKAVDDFNRLKADTDYWGQKLAVAQQSGNEAEIQKAQIEYNNALRLENDSARNISDTYPGEYEGGPGTGGRAYVKPRPQQPKPQRGPRSSGGRPTAISLEEAAKLLQ